MFFVNDLHSISFRSSVEIMKILAAITNSNGPFLPGQDIEGRVFCCLSDPCLIEVKIMLIGEECTYSDETEAKDIAKMDNCWKVNFIENETTIVHLGHFNVAEHKFLFKVNLPTRLPGSYLGKYGHVKYFLRAYMTINGSETEQDEIDFKIFSPIDLNNTNASLAPTTISDMLVLPMWWCISVPIVMDVKLEKTAFVLGETINVVMEFASHSSSYISELVVQLYMRIVMKVPGTIKKFGICRSLALERISRVHYLKRKAYITRLKIPEDAEIPNFEKCQLFVQKAFLEVTAVLKDSSKPKLKIQRQVFLGHYPLDNPEKRSSNIQETVGFRLSAYGLTDEPLNNSNMSTSVPSLYSALETSSITPTEQYKQPISVPPYPTGPTSNLFSNIEELAAPMSSPRTKKSVPNSTNKRNVPYPKDSCTYRKVDAPCPVENRCPYPVETFKKPFTNSAENLPYPKNTIISPPYPKENTPYPTESKCPYPIENFKEIQTSRTPDRSPSYPKKSSKSSPYPNKNTPYPAESKCPYPTEKFKENQSFKTLDGQPSYPKRSNISPPYPKENAPYPAESKCPYPTENFKEIQTSRTPDRSPSYPKKSNKSSPYPNKNTPYPAESKCPYPTENFKENQSFRTLDELPSYPKKSIISPPYPKENTSYPAESKCPYPTENFNKSQPFRTPDRSPSYPKRSSKSSPYPKENTSYPSESKCPYPTGDVKETQPFTVPSMSPPYPNKEPVDNKSPYSSGNICPYPTEEVFRLETFSAPYPKDEFSLQVHHRTNVSSTSRRSSFGKERLPYPSEAEEEAHLLSHTDHLSSQMPKLPKFIENNTSSYSRKVEPSYPTTENSLAFGNSAPYPLEKPSPHSTLGFTEFKPMPMPSIDSPITCNSVGFAVPTSQALNVHQPEKTLEADIEPSAPLFSDIKTPPIASIEELDDLLVTLTTSTDNLPNVSVRQLPSVPTTDIEISEESALLETSASSNEKISREKLATSERKMKKYRLKESAC